MRLLDKHFRVRSDSESQQHNLQNLVVASNFPKPELSQPTPRSREMLRLEQLLRILRRCIDLQTLLIPPKSHHHLENRNHC